MYHHNPILNLLIWVLTGFGIFGKRFRHARNLLSQTQNEIVYSVAMVERLKAEIETLKVRQESERQKQTIELENAQARWTTQQEMERKKFEAEKLDLITRSKLDTEVTLKRNEMKYEEMSTLARLDYEQKIKQNEIDKERSLLTIKEEYARKETQLHQTTHQTMYAKLSEALSKMTLEGDKNTKFVHELMMKIFDKAPGLNNVDITNRNYTGLAPTSNVQPQIVAPLEVERV